MEKLFSRIPSLEGENIALKGLTHADAPALQRFIADSAVYRYLPAFLFEQQYTDMHEMIDRLYDSCFRAKESLILGVYNGGLDGFCGLVEFYGYKESIRKVCIGYRLSSAHWGKGIATEAVRLMVNYLYTQTDTEIITASTMVENKASARVLEKNGFIRTACAVAEDWGFPRPTLADKWFR